MDLSIGIVNYNGGALLQTCLDSVFSHTRGIRFETIVVDNHSEDGSIHLLSADKRISRLIRNNKNLGYAKACNQLLSCCNGKYVLLLNPDVSFSGNVIGEMFRFMEEHPEAGAAGCKIRFPDGTLQGSCGTFPNRAVILLRSLAADKVFKRIPFFQDRLDFAYCTFPTAVQEVDWILGAFFLVRKRLFDRLGTMDENYFLYGEEIDFCHRIRRDRIKILFNPNVEVVHAMGASTRRHPWRSVYHFHKAMLRLHRKFVMPEMGIMENTLVLNGIFLKMLLAYGRHLSGIRRAREIYAHRPS